MKSVILIAAPAAGKGTEAALLKEQYNMPHISTGDILREKAKEDSDLGRDINNNIMPHSSFIFNPNALVNELSKRVIIFLSLIESGFKTPSCQNFSTSLIRSSTGFPRSITIGL